MTKKTVFDFDDYKEYLQVKFEASGGRSGVKQKAAAYINCQTTYVSQVLHKRAHFSLEQAERLNGFLGHTNEETHFFLLLVQKCRAGTRDLEQYFARQIVEIRSQRRHVDGRLGETAQFSEAMKAQYYERWLTLAVHVATSVPELQTREALCEYFDIDATTIQSTLDFLIKVGAVQEQDGRYLHQSAQVHLSHRSPLILRHHANWRVEALKALDRSQNTDLNYSVVYSLSREDAEKIRKRFVEIIDENLKFIAPSQEEVLYCNTIDFFELRSGGNRGRGLAGQGRHPASR